MLKTFTFDLNPMTPLKVIYPYGDNMSLKATLITFNDGFRVYSQPLCYALKDIKINKSTILLLTSAVDLKSVFDILQEPITLEKLENKYGLVAAGNSKFLTTNDSTKKIYATATTLTNSGFFRFVPIGEQLVQIHYKSLLLTVDKTYPYDVSFQPVLNEDIYDQQKFTYFIDGTNLQLMTKAMIDGISYNILKYYLSYDPNTFQIKAIGSVNNNYNFTIKEPSNRPSFQSNDSLTQQPRANLAQHITNYDGTLYWIKYFSKFQEQHNNKNVEIDQDTSIKNVPLNFLITGAYKTKIENNNLMINMCSLKNYQTPEYEYTGNKFYLQQYKISGEVKLESYGDPLSTEGIYLSGFPDYVQTNSDGGYSTIVDKNWSGTVVPIKRDFTFTPTVYVNVNNNYVQNYEGRARFVVEGYVYFPEYRTATTVILSGFPLPVETDLQGYYSTIVGYGWSGTIIPIGAHSIFVPPSIGYVGVQQDISQDYIAYPKYGQRLEEG